LGQNRSISMQFSATQRLGFKRPQDAFQSKPTHPRKTILVKKRRCWGRLQAVVGPPPTVKNLYSSNRPRQLLN
jgi:hypothetical protein